MKDFDGIDAKIVLARQRLNELASSFKAFCENQQNEVRVETDHSAGTKRIVFSPTEAIPLAWSAAIGEILYDLRSALDHAVYVMTARRNPELLDERFTAFPISETAGNWDAAGGSKAVRPNKRAGRYKIRALPAEAIAVIERIQPFRVEPPLTPEQTTLWIFDRLANIDKHRTLNICRFRSQGAQFHPGDSPLSVKQIVISMPLKLEEGTVLMQWQPSGDLDSEPEFAVRVEFDIAFDEAGPQATHLQGVISSLNEFGSLVLDILRELRRIHESSEDDLQPPGEES